MNCIEYKELISAYLDDELSSEELRWLLSHLEICEDCKNELAVFSSQKEKLVSLRLMFLGPLPEPNFSQKVMTKILTDETSPKRKISLEKFFNLFNWIDFSIKKPLQVGIYSILILFGVLIGAIFQDQQIGEKKLLSVYELQDTKVPSREKSYSIARLPDEEKAIVFHHVAYSSVETLINEPCLLKYTAYTYSDH